VTAGNTVAPGAGAAQLYGSAPAGDRTSANLADILERVLDKGLVIAGDIQVNLLVIELLTIKLRLVIASLDTAREAGIDWWENDPWLSAHAGIRADERKQRSQTRRVRGRVDEADELDEPEEPDELEAPADEAPPPRAKGRAAG